MRLSLTTNPMYSGSGFGSHEDYRGRAAIEIKMGGASPASAALPGLKVGPTFPDPYELGGQRDDHPPHHNIYS
jgi:hypothetical protein